MKCENCGNELTDEMQFCNNCGAKISNVNNEEKKEEEKKLPKKIKINVMDVINRKDTLNTTNKVAYIAKGWALQVRNRGQNLAIIVALIYFVVGIVASSNIPYNSSVSGFQVFISQFGRGILYAILIVMIFNTTAFVIRMGAEVIQLLDDIKNK